MGCVDKKIPYSKNTLLLKKENSTPEHLVFSKIKHSIMLLKKQGKSRHRETPAAPKLPASLYACFLVKGLGNFKPTDEADADLFFGEDSYSFNHPVYQVEYSVRSRSSAEMSSMISLALFSRPISCLASSSACFFICLSWSISLLICLIRRSPISLSSIVSSRSKSLFRSWSLFSITRELIAAFSPPIQCISASCRVAAFFSGGLELAH